MADDETLILNVTPPDAVIATVVPPITTQVLVDAPPLITARIAAAQGPSGPRGLRGDKGERGEPGGRFFKLSYGPLSGARVVRVMPDGEHVAAASALDAAHARSIIGVSLQSAAGPDEEVEVVRVGEMEDSSWAFVPGRSVFVGAAGELTQTFDPAWLYVRVIGVASAPMKLMVDLRPPTFRAR